ncbi:hypothetical protein GF325_12880 [Candidatus Bathyarchaeota archaeon]|nr:hypothetical protein [Candidatus Bathyarchaeota archaeon]
MHLIIFCLMASIGWHVYFLASVIPFAITILIIPRQIKFMKKHDWVGFDIHKEARPAVAESGGLSMILGVAVGICILMAFVPSHLIMFMAVLASIILASVIGIIDDKLKLSAFKKIASTVIATVPMVAFYIATDIIPGTPPVPFLGTLQVTILYLPFIPGFLSVMMNAVNMLEGYNGEGSGTAIIVTVALLIAGIINGSMEAILLSLPVLASLIAFFFYNRYPAKIFPGDIGTLQVGMALGCIAIVGSLEFVVVIAFIPHFLNAFHVIRSVRGFKESSTIVVKDIEMIEGDMIKASKDPKAAMSLPRIITASGPLSEPELVRNIMVLTVVSSSFSVYSAILQYMTINGTIDDEIWISLLYLAINAVGCIVIFLLFPPLRGLIIIIASIFLAVLGLLILIDRFVIEIGFFNWLLAGALALIGGGAWYLLSMKYFAHITTRGK